MGLHSHFNHIISIFIRNFFPNIHVSQISFPELQEGNKTRIIHNLNVVNKPSIINSIYHHHYHPSLSSPTEIRDSERGSNLPSRVNEGYAFVDFTLTSPLLESFLMDISNLTTRTFPFICNFTTRFPFLSFFVSNKSVDINS